MTYKNDYLHDKYQGRDTSDKVMMRVNAVSINNFSHKPHTKLRRWFFGGSISILLLLALFWQPVYDSTSIILSSASEEIRQAGWNAGLSMHGQAIFLRNHPEFVNADMLASECPHDGGIVEYGCYLPGSQKIYILKVDEGVLKPIEFTAVAHETLHAAWNEMSLNDRKATGDTLMAFYNSKASESLTNDAIPYQKESPDVFVNELHSLSGSEVETAAMPIPLQSHYSRYFSEQTKPVQAKNSFDQNLNNEIADINARGKQLDSDSQALDEFQTAHLDNIKASMQRNLYYGDVYTYNKNVDAYNYNREIYNNMVITYNNNVNAYNTARQSFVDAYSMLFPGKSIPVTGAK